MEAIARGQLTLTDLSDIISQPLAPSNPTEGMLWMDTGVTPPVLKVFKDGKWVIQNDFKDDPAYGTITTTLKTNTSAIDILKKEIDLKVTQSQVTESITGMINGIKIGGRNLWIKKELQSGYETQGNITPSGATCHQTMKTLTSVKGEGSVVYQIWNPNKIVNSVNSNRIAFYRTDKTWISSIAIPALNGEYQTLEIPLPDGTEFIRLGAITGLPQEANDDSIKIKFEIGTKATDWSPSPEDTQNSIDEADVKITETKDQVAQINISLDGINQKVQNTETSLTEVKGSVDNLTSSHALAHSANLVIHGDSDKYYPVYIQGGNQDVLRTIKIWRSYSEQAPSDWYNATHKGSLMTTWQGNFGGWGGASYKEYLLEHSCQYAQLLADLHTSVHSMGYTFFLRGGGETGAIYHFASDQGINPRVFYNGAEDVVFDHSNDSHKVYAYEPKLVVNHDRINNLKIAKESSVSTVKNQVAEINIELDGITSTVSDVQTTTTKLVNEATQNKKNIRCNDIGGKINYSGFSTANLGEIYLHGYDSNNNPTDTNGSIEWNGKTIAISKGMINPDGIFGNRDVYLCLIPGESIANRIFGVYHNGTEWRYNWLMGSTSSGACQLDANYVVIGQFKQKSAEEFEYAYLYSNPVKLENAVGISNVETRLKTAESKITPDAITNTVKNHQTDGKNTFAQTSIVEQLVDSVNHRFEESGGYNLLRNGDAKGGLKFWVSNGGGITINNTSKGPAYQTSMPAGIHYAGGEEDTYWVKLKPNTDYVYSAFIYSNIAHASSSRVPLHFYCSTGKTTEDISGCGILDYDQSLNAKTWKKVYVHFRTIGSDIWFRPFIYGTASQTINVKEIGLYETKVPLSFSPHPSEVYGGVTSIDKDGIKVTSTTGNVYTEMKSSGFYLKKNDGTSLITADQNGLAISGKITALSGSDIDNGLSQGTKDKITSGANAFSLAAALAHGKVLYKDPTFKTGSNGVYRYDNNVSGNVNLTREARPAGAPSASTHSMKIRVTGGGASPGHGGFYFGTNTRANARFIVKFIANIPTGRNLVFASNPIGTGGAVSKWLTPSVGTGDWQEYLYEIKCGDTGSFSSTAFFYLEGGSTPTAANPLDWWLAYATVIDVTEAEKNYDIFSDRVDDWTASGKTTINGGRIETNTINAASIVAGSITSDKIHANGISADKVKTGALTSTNNKTVLNLNDGTFRLGNTSDGSYLQYNGSSVELKGRMVITGGLESVGENLLNMPMIQPRNCADYEVSGYQIRFRRNARFGGIVFYDLKDILPLNVVHTVQYKVKKTAGTLIDFSMHLDSTQLEVTNYTIDGATFSYDDGKHPNLNDGNWHIINFNLKRKSHNDGNGSGETNRLVPQPNRQYEADCNVEMKDFQIESSLARTAWRPSASDQENAINAAHDSAKNAANLAGSASVSANTANNQLRDWMPKDSNGNISATVIDGAKIATGTLHADAIEAGTFIITDDEDKETFNISKEGEVKIDGTLQSYNFDDNAGYQISRSGDAVFNQATIRGTVDLIDAGVTNYGSQRGGANLLPNSDFSRTTTHSQTTNKHHNLYASSWGGYNPGVSNPTTTFHAHIDNTTFGYNVVEYNESDGVRGWKGISTVSNPENGKSYTYSFDAYSTIPNARIFGGFYYTMTGGTSQSFHAGSYNVTTFKPNQWERHTVTVPFRSDRDMAKGCSFYMYGYGFGSNGIVYIKNIKLEEGVRSTPWCPSKAEQSGEEVRIWAGSAYRDREKAPFRVLANGDIFATRGTFSGDIVSASINIDNLKIDENGHIIYSNSTSRMGEHGVLHSSPRSYVEYMRLSPSIANFNQTVAFGNPNSPNIKISNHTMEIGSNYNFRLTNPSGMANITYDPSNGATGGLRFEDAQRPSESMHVVRYSRTSKVGTMIFDSEGSKNNFNDGDFAFTRKNFEGSVAVNVYGTLKVQNSLESIDNKFRMVKESDGISFFVE